MTPPVTPPTRTGEPSAELLRKIQEQGVAETATFERLLGAGKDLWADDAEFERFLASIKATRAEKG